MNKEITTYLKDHLAGSVAALELIDHLIEVHSGRPLERFFIDLKGDIESDQAALEKLLLDPDHKQSRFRRLAAWVAEKFARSKFKFAGEEFGEAGLVQAFEMLALGIRGKELLWRALATSNWAALQNVDLPQLEQRAMEQQQRVEEKRLEAARAAFG